LVVDGDAVEPRRTEHTDVAKVHVDR
jgi:hypothetical protein